MAIPPGARSMETTPDILSRLPQPRIGEKVFNGFRDAAVAIFRLGPNRRQGLFIARGRNALVSPQALSHVADIRFGNRDIDGEIDRDAGFVFDLFAAQLRNRALEHLRVKIKSERVHVSGLLPAEQIARASQFQIQEPRCEIQRPIPRTPEWRPSRRRAIGESSCSAGIKR